MPNAPKQSTISTAAGSDQRQGQIQANIAIAAQATLAFALSHSSVLSWSSAISASGQSLGRGSTDTNIGTGAFQFRITGQAATEAKAAVAAGTALGALGTTAADQWAVFAVDAATGGTISVAAGAGNVAGYATEALAFAARPARITAKARLGYFTVKTMTATAWIAGTDALAGGTTGNEASATNYYPHDGVFAAVGVATNAITNVTGATYPLGSANPWSGGRNGITVPTVMAIGSTDTNVATTAFIFNANGIQDINKAAVAAGTALGALGTIPADKWGVIVGLINTAGTISWMSGPSNYGTGNGYATQQQAINDLAQITPTAGNAIFGYLTVKTGVGLAWIAGTDALAGGTTGNKASATNYYPTAGIGFNDLSTPSQLIPTGSFGAAQISTDNNILLTSAQF